MLGMLSFSNLGEGVRAPMMVDIGGVRQGVSWYRPSIQSSWISVAVLPQF